MIGKYTTEEVLHPCDTYGQSLMTGFLELAELFFNDRFDAHKDGYSLAICPWLNEFGRTAFRTAFKPRNIPEDMRWFDGYKYYGTSPLSEQAKQEIDAVNDHRVFALLFMHEMHKDYLEYAGLNG